KTNFTFSLRRPLCQGSVESYVRIHVGRVLITHSVRVRLETMGHSTLAGPLSEMQVRRIHVTICKYSVSLASLKRWWAVSVSSGNTSVSPCASLKKKHPMMGAGLQPATYRPE